MKKSGFSIVNCLSRLGRILSPRVFGWRCRLATRFATLAKKRSLVLVIQFNSLMVPLIIMTTVVLSLIGALAGLLICDLPFGIIMTGLGVISLAGVVVNNAIVLLAYTRQLQSQGMELVAAAAEAGVTRFRPVLLTVAVVVIFGLGFATILTLVVVPSLYVMLSRLSLRLGFKGLSAEHPGE